MESRDSALRVRPGRAAPEPPQDLIERASSRRRSLSRQQYLDGIMQGQRTILARAITLIESSRAPDRQLAEQILEDCLPHTGNSTRVGITGVPGAGKSSIIEVVGMSLIRDRKQKVAVLAIDPSSQLSGGSILGDKTRMKSLAASDMAFIRPSPSRGSLGGVAQRTREVMLLCEAAGYENIIVETVGVGQSETAVHDMVDFFLLIALSGAGDELQGMKRGVMELADLVVINKADGSNRAAAEKARAEAQNALHYFPSPQSGWKPRALTCSARTGHGIPELWNCVLEYTVLTKANGWLSLTRRNQARQWMHEIIQHGLRQRFESHPAIQERMEALEQDVLQGRTTSFRAARTLLEMSTDSTTPDRHSNPSNI
ncbi:MAG: methylmalonyl Co-A mutase-associated GTPase MeaB [Terriglobales bacterium]